MTSFQRFFYDHDPYLHLLFKMRYVRGGNVDGEVEEVINGYIFQNSRSTIKASWLGVDGQSGIKNYWVAVGTAPSKT